MAKKVGLRIRAARDEADLTQRKLASRVAVDKDVISRWERGINKPDLEMLDLLGRELHVPAAFFVEGLGTKPERASDKSEALGEDHQEGDEVLLALVREQMQLLRDFQKETVAELRAIRRTLRTFAARLPAPPEAAAPQRRTRGQR